MNNIEVNTLKNGYVVLFRQIAPAPSFFTVDNVASFATLKLLFEYVKENIVDVAVGEMLTDDYMPGDSVAKIILRSKSFTDDQHKAIEFRKAFLESKANESFNEICKFVSDFCKLFSEIGSHYYECTIISPFDDTVEGWKKFFELEDGDEEIQKVRYAVMGNSQEEIDKILCDR